MTSRPPDISVAELREWLDYDPETGLLMRKKSIGTACAGDGAGCANGQGYIQIKLKGRIYQAHRLGWTLYTGEWPNGQIDHVDGDPGNNRISNLRLASLAQNGANRRLGKNNTSGVKGVRMFKGKWRANIKVHGRLIHLGTFDTFEEAVAVRKAAEAKYFGEFAWKGGPDAQAQSKTILDSILDDRAPLDIILQGAAPHGSL